MKKLVITLALIVNTTFVIAQNEQIRHEPSFSILISPFNYQNQSPANLNSFLVSNGFPQAKKSAMSYFPIRLTLTGNKLLLGLEKSYDGVFTKKSDVGQTIINSSFSNFQVGYDISKSQNFRLFPTIGFGTMRYSAEIVSKTNKSIDFENLINDTDATNRRKLFAKSPMIDFGMEIQSNFVASMPFRMSLKTGYRMALKNTKWTSDYDIKNAPSENLSGFYVQLGYSFGKNKKK